MVVRKGHPILLHVVHLYHEPRMESGALDHSQAEVVLRKANRTLSAKYVCENQAQVPAGQNDGGIVVLNFLGLDTDDQAMESEGVGSWLTRNFVAHTHLAIIDDDPWMFETIVLEMRHLKKSKNSVLDKMHKWKTLENSKINLPRNGLIPGDTSN
jgi:hypothetical protein